MAAGFNPVHPENPVHPVWLSGSGFSTPWKFRIFWGEEQPVSRKGREERKDGVGGFGGGTS
jgi:hypothetical protein